MSIPLFPNSVCNSLNKTNPCWSGNPEGVSLEKRRVSISGSQFKSKMNATIVLRKKTVRLPKRKQCDRCQDNWAARKDDHLQECCGGCWEELQEMYCYSCRHEYRGHDQDCCPRCKHHPDDPECPCGCKDEEED